VKRKRPGSATIKDSSRDGPAGTVPTTRDFRRPKSDPQQVPLIEAEDVVHGDDLGTQVDTDAFELPTAPGGVNWRASVIIALQHLQSANAQLADVQQPRVQVANADVALAARVLNELLNRP
jgi:hypothetical protein